VLRSFVARAESLGIDYNIIEAYDQPWKTFERLASARTGACSTPGGSRNSPGPGRSPTPIIGSSPAIAVLIGRTAVCCSDSLARRRDASQTALLAATAHIVGAWFAILFAYWNGHYFVTGGGESPTDSRC